MADDTWSNLPSGPITVDCVVEMRNSLAEWVKNPPVVHPWPHEDDYWACSDCGADGYGFHACPGRPGEGEF